MDEQRAAFDLERYDTNGPLPDIDTDIPRARKGLVGGQFWAAFDAFVPGTPRY